jgi:hypothetical protein
MAVVGRRKRRWKGRVFRERERAMAISKTSVAGRLKYDIYLLRSGRNREL